jgi:hypothetical protein
VITFGLLCRDMDLFPFQDRWLNTDLPLMEYVCYHQFSGDSTIV